MTRAASNQFILDAAFRWTNASLWTRLMIWLFARRDRFVSHLGDFVEIGWWREEAYLISIEGET